MNHALASVVLLGLVIGCNSSDDATADGDASTTASGGTSGAGGSTGRTTGVLDGDSASVTTTTGSIGTGTNSAASTGGPGTGAAGGSGGEGGMNGEGGLAGEAGAPNYPDNPHPAIAMTRAQRQALIDAQNNTATSTTGSVEPDPDEIWVAISDLEMVCSEYPWPLPCGGHWLVDIMLTRSMQHVGTYDLTGQWFGTGWSTEADDPDFPDICGGGFGTGGVGTAIVEVLEISDSEISFRLHADSAFVHDDINGIYTVPLCP